MSEFRTTLSNRERLCINLLVISLLVIPPTTSSARTAYAIGGTGHGSSSTASWAYATEDSVDCLNVEGVFPSVETAHDVVAADVNEDGHLDLAIVGHLPLHPERGLAVLLGDGRGGFVPFQFLQVGDHNHGLIAVDLNHDGHVDLATTTADRREARFEVDVVRTFLGDGTGRFPEDNLWKVKRDGLGPLDVQAADLNNDGNLDLVAAGAGIGQVAVLLGDGRGNFQQPRFFQNRLTRTRTTVIADFNGDGNLDVIVSNRFGKSLSLLLGDGEGNLSFANSFPTGVGPRTVIAADLNGDEYLDLAVTTRESNGISILLGRGAGRFTRHYNILTGRDPRAIRSGDFNNDGFLDLAVANSLTQNVSFLFSDGVGGFGTAMNLPVGTAPIRGRIKTGGGKRVPGVGAGIVGLDARDVNEDGAMDLLVTSTFDGNVYVLINHCQQLEN